MSFDSYYQRFTATAATSPLVKRVLLSSDQITDTRGSIEGYLLLFTGHQLHIAEYVVMDPTGIQRIKYRFHLQDASKRLVCRWDNAPHHPTLPTFPDHCHLADGSVIASPPMDLAAVLLAIVPLLNL